MSIPQTIAGLMVIVGLSIQANPAQAEWSWRTPFGGVFSGDTEAEGKKKPATKSKPTASKAKSAVSRGAKTKTTPVKSPGSEKGFLARATDAITPGKPTSNAGSKPFSSTPKRPTETKTTPKKGTNWFGSWSASGN